MPEDRGGLTPPVPFSESMHPVVEVSEGSDDQKHVDVGGGVVDGCRDVGDADGWAASAARVGVDLVVAGSFILSGLLELGLVGRLLGNWIGWRGRGGKYRNGPKTLTTWAMH